MTNGAIAQLMWSSHRSTSRRTRFQRGISEWAKAFYLSQKAKGKSHQAAVRALAYKWIRIIWKCWQTRTNYDEARYLECLRKKGSALVPATT